MIHEVVQREEMQSYVDAVRQQLADHRLDQPAAAAAGAIEGQPAADPVATVLGALPQPGRLHSSGGEPDHVPYLSRDPMVSLLQSSLDEKLRANGVVEERPHEGPWTRIGHAIERIARHLLQGEQMGPRDPAWVTDVGSEMLKRLSKGNHPFNERPAELEIDEPPLLVVVGDWGSGLPRACAVGSLMAKEVADGIGAGRSVHVIHLGDVYYSGTEDEYRRNVLADGRWPVTAAQAREHGVTSWALNGNHDMYGGGWGFFEVQLGDARFARQRSADGPTSFFRIRTPRWDLVGLDTSWDPRLLAQGHQGVLQDPQAAWVARWAEDAAATDRRLMLLSHHQLVSALDTGDVGVELARKLGPVLDAGRVRAWLWGHEHRCVGYSPQQGVEYLRCIGHGGVPIAPFPQDQPVPPPGIWMERGSFQDGDGVWGRFGYAVLDFQADGRIAVRYVDDLGQPTPDAEVFEP
jgi:Calcineurin-like phosphoesterase